MLCRDPQVYLALRGCITFPYPMRYTVKKTGGITRCGCEITIRQSQVHCCMYLTSKLFTASSNSTTIRFSAHSVQELISKNRRITSDWGDLLGGLPGFKDWLRFGSTNLLYFVRKSGHVELRRYPRFDF